MAEPRYILTESELEKRIGEGSDFLNGQDYASAVDHFAKLLEEAVAKYGEFHDVLGKVYLYYGQALVGLARDESDVVAINLNQSEAGDSASVENGAEPVTKPEAGSKTTNGEEKEVKPDEVEKDDEEESEDGDDETAQNDDGNPEDPENDDAENGNDVENLQLAWEILEIAKKIFSAEETEVSQRLLVETLYTLGDVSIESENFATAVTDLTECSKLHKAVDPDKLRRLADIHYKLSLALSFQNDFDSAQEHLNISRDLLKQQIDELEKKIIESENDKDKKEANDSMHKEISDLEDVLKEVEEKIGELTEQKDAARTQVREMLEKLMPKPNGVSVGTSEGTSGNITPSAQVAEEVNALNLNKTKSPEKNVTVNNISHLVRRKRPSEEALVEAPTKQAKPNGE